MTFAADLASAVGAAYVIDDPDVLASAERDWTGRYGGRALALVRPGSTADVSAVVALCRRDGVPIVAQGGNTGLVGGSVPRTTGDRPVVLSTTRLDTLSDVDRASGQVTAGAGVPLARLQAHAATAGFTYAVDFSARDSATVGGSVATNAGGMHAIAWGNTRAQVVGVEAVLGDGTVVSRLGGLVKDNTGYDLAGLLAGSEGTLGIVTAARLRLRPRATRSATALVPVASVQYAVELFIAARAEVPGLCAAELVLPSALDLVTRVAALPSLPSAGAYVLLDACGADDPAVALAAVLSDGAGTLANDSAGRRQLWAYRDRITEAIATTGVPHKLDIALPLGEMAAFVAALDGITGHATTYVFGHLGDGNLHVNVVGPPPDDSAVDDAVLRLAVAHGGTISAEHGIGIAKTAWLPLCRSEAEIAAMRAIKSALDPDGILNPGVLFT